VTGPDERPPAPAYGSLVPRSTRPHLHVSSEGAVGAAALTGLLAGLALRLTGSGTASDAALAISSTVMLVPLAWSVARSLARRDVGVDGIALVAIVAALVLGEYLAAAVVAVMLAGGNALEASAGRHARRELTALVERMPRVARRRDGAAIEEVPVAELAVGDVVVVSSGEVVPVDGVVAGEQAVLDQSSLTGEPLPVTRHRDEEVLSGVANAGPPFELRATRRAADSAYAALVRLVEDAEQHKARFVRVADRYAAIFLPITLLVASAAWAVSGDPVRALAVLVVATPCPLILAAPIALVAGVSRAASVGVIVKGAAAIEQLGSARSVLLDKTGTVTAGLPSVERVVTVDAASETEVLRLAAGVDQLSAHSSARALVREARGRRLELAAPRDVVETPGAGIAGTVDGRLVAVGTAAYVGHGGTAVAAGDDDSGEVAVAIDGRLAGVIVLGDRLREDAVDVVERLRAAGIRQVVLATGDGQTRAEAIGRALGVARVCFDLTPQRKLALIDELRADPDLRAVLMAGDGVNDAPALAAADVGIAMAGAGATIASETADAVIVGERIGRIVDAIVIGRRSLAIARQCVLVGIGLSVLAMAVAAAGYLTPVQGAILQEGIDVAVILNALRARGGIVGT